MAILPKVLLVDDDELMRTILVTILEQDGFEVFQAGDVPEALRAIANHPFDVLVSDLHMPGAGDGLTVVSAMRHVNPRTVTILLSAFPEMDTAARTIIAQTDQILVKPSGITNIAATIRSRLALEPVVAPPIETLPTILDRSIDAIVDAWYARVELDPLLMTIPLTRERRAGHIPQILRDLSIRLRSPHPLGARELYSGAAQDHGRLRRQQGYSTAMIVDESRMLQVSIFEALQINVAHLDFSLLLVGVMQIADEVDSQLSQAMDTYSEEAALATNPA